MWSERCRHCERQQLFGIRRLTGLVNLDDGAIAVGWSCGSCGGENVLLTGQAHLEEGATR